ncbi:MAG: CotH kinase family protein, partial [Verrucomicrobiota bacterium]
IAGRHFHSDQSTRPGLAGYLGIDHQYGEATVTIDGEMIEGIGLRYKGNGTFLEGHHHGKYSFKIDFNEYDDDLSFRGLTKLNLQNNVTDASLLREAISYQLFREAGIPCSRVGFARVTLTVGDQAKKNLGLYSLVEQVGKRFLKSRFGNADGLLLKPSTFGAFRHLGTEWEAYEKAYFPKTKASAEHKERLFAFTRLVHEADQSEFERELTNYLDVDEFLKFLAVNVFLSNLDSFLGSSQNHYIYLHPGTNLFQVWPWDLDHSFGSFPLVGTPRTREQLSILHPAWEENRLIDRVLAIPQWKKAYQDQLRTFLGTIFAEDKIHRQIDDAAQFLRPLVEENEKKRAKMFDRLVSDRPSKKDAVQPLKPFISERRKSILLQLDDESEGEIVKMNGLPDFREWLVWIAAFLILLLLNFGIFIWNLVAGFRGSVLWGFLNFLYPVSPWIYGFGVRPDLGRRAAIASVFGVGLLGLLFVVAQLQG